MTQRVERLGEDVKAAYNTLSTGHDGAFLDWDHPLELSRRQTLALLSVLDQEIDVQQREFDDKMVGIVLDHLKELDARYGRPVEGPDLEHILRQFSLSDEQITKLRSRRSFE
jgi:hypothetical protein